MKEEHKHFAELHDRAVNLFEQATESDELNIEALSEAFTLEHEVARAVIDLGLSELSVYTYNASAAMMAHLLGRNEEALSILKDTQTHLTNGKLIRKIEDKVRDYQDSTKTPRKCTFHGSQYTEIGLPPINVVTQTRLVIEYGSPSVYIVFGSMRKDTGFMVPNTPRSMQRLMPEMSS